MATSGAPTAVRWPLLASLPEPEVRELLSAARRRRFDRHEVVFHEGDPGDSMHLIDSGHASRCASRRLSETR